MWCIPGKEPKAKITPPTKKQKWLRLLILIILWLIQLLGRIQLDRGWRTQQKQQWRRWIQTARRRRSTSTRKRQVRPRRRRRRCRQQYTTTGDTEDDSHTNSSSLLFMYVKNSIVTSWKRQQESTSHYYIARSIKPLQREHETTNNTLFLLYLVLLQDKLQDKLTEHCVIHFMYCSIKAHIVLRGWVRSLT